MDKDISVAVDIDVPNVFEYAFKTSQELAVASNHDYQYNYYAPLITAPETACEELTEHYIVTIAYVSGMPLFDGHEAVTIALVYNTNNILKKDYSSTDESAIIRIEIYKR